MLIIAYLYYYLFIYYFNSLVFLTLVSSNLLYPNHWSDEAELLLFKSSVIVSIFASALSARLSAIASIRAGFLGEPYSSSP